MLPGIPTLPSSTGLCWSEGFCLFITLHSEHFSPLPELCSLGISGFCICPPSSSLAGDCLPAHTCGRAHSSQTWFPGTTRPCKHEFLSNLVWHRLFSANLNAKKRNVSAKRKRVFWRKKKKILCCFVAFVHKIMRPNISPLDLSQISSYRLIQLVDHDSVHYLKQCCGKRHTAKLARWCLSCHPPGSRTNAACIFSHQQGKERETWR